MRQKEKMSELTVLPVVVFLADEVFLKIVFHVSLMCVCFTVSSEFGHLHKKGTTTLLSGDEFAAMSVISSSLVAARVRTILPERR